MIEWGPVVALSSDFHFRRLAHVADGRILLERHSWPGNTYIRTYARSGAKPDDFWLYAGDLPGNLSDEEIIEKALALAVTCHLEDL
jgi:hypothetical protein